ncbi:hypothetical protein [Neobacillus ginsengisoli]|uniref:2-keto-4-pentenoate hydratase n=1 Tax=Neobacillus ginsengisoli TaxID=904295 RepID=A0ABT9XQR5_9BACI|nr:hypothetical protein [Neobacillus ginsengisoli]MDQ0197897.1 2-keto-4-pentenoate hydratase [Neobacillus ginsengisoli]
MNIQIEARRLIATDQYKLPIEPLSDNFPEISIKDAYLIQLQK